MAYAQQDIDIELAALRKRVEELERKAEQLELSRQASNRANER